MSFRDALLAVFIVAALALVPQACAQAVLTNQYVLESRGQLPANLADIVTAAGGSLHRVHPEIGIATATSTDPNFAARLVNTQLFQQVSQDMMMQWVPGQASLRIAGSIPAAAGPSTPVPALAFFFACQWNMTQIDAPGAWAKGQFGGPSVEVADLDTGVDPFHIDLAGKVDLALSTSLLTPGSSPCGAPDETTIFDFNAHGTFVSGIITSNNLGVAGVAPLSNVVAVKVLNCHGVGSFGDIIAGIIYASGLPGVKIINMSLGALVQKSVPGVAGLAAALNKAVNFAASQGKLVVAAAGNDGVDLDHDGNFISIPAESGTAVSIYATDILDNLASYSNHGAAGTWVGAPGGDLPNPAAPLAGSPIPQALQSLVLGPCSVFVCGDEEHYLVGAGTSFSTAMASGTAALVDAKHGGLLNSHQLTTILAQSADDLGKPGVDDIFSHGRINASNAVDH